MSLDKTFIAVGLINSEDAASRARVDQHNVNAEKDAKINSQAQELNRLRNDAKGLPPPSQDEISLKEKVEDYENLLSKPMLEIAKQNGSFKQTYEKQQQIMAEWMLSQKAFKEIALQYGKKLGKSPEEVLEEFKDVQEDVLNNKAEFEKVDVELVNDLNASEKRKAVDAEKSKLAEEKRKAIAKQFNLPYSPK